MKTCLNCKYEPEWSERRNGKCQYPVKLPLLPKTYRIFTEYITRYDDDSGVIKNCPTWQEKE